MKKIILLFILAIVCVGAIKLMARIIRSQTKFDFHTDSDNMRHEIGI